MGRRSTLCSLVVRSGSSTNSESCELFGASDDELEEPEVLEDTELDRARSTLACVEEAVAMSWLEKAVKRRIEFFAAAGDLQVQLPSPRHRAPRLDRDQERTLITSACGRLVHKSHHIRCQTGTPTLV